MAARLLISEVLNKLKEFNGDGAILKKVEWLRKHDSPTLRLLLKHGFDPKIQYNLPEGDPPFKRNPNPIGLSETNLHAETRKLSYLWLQPSKLALTEMSEEQRTRLKAAEDIESQKGNDLLNATRAFQEAEDEFASARQALVDAQSRLNRATAHVQATRQQLTTAKTIAEQISQQVAQLRAQILRTNNELLQRDAPPVVTMPKYKLESMFIQTLEALHPTEADVLLAVKNKTLQKKFPITKDLVKKAFPEIL